MWRPGDWENKHPCVECVHKEEDEHGLVCDLACGLFTRYVYKEAGADAMLEALGGEHIEEGKHYCSPCGVCSSDEDCHASESGRLVFIPEDE